MRIKFSRRLSFLARKTSPMRQARLVCLSISLGKQVEVPSVGISLQNLSNRRIDRNWDSQSSGDTTSNIRRSRESFLFSARYVSTWTVLQFSVLQSTTTYT